jgi:hypothetical protein
LVPEYRRQAAGGATANEEKEKQADEKYHVVL